MSHKEEQESKTGTGSGGDGHVSGDGSPPRQASQREQALGDGGNVPPVPPQVVPGIGHGGGQWAQGTGGRGAGGGGGGGGGEGSSSGRGKKRGRPSKGKEQAGETSDAVEGEQPRKKAKFDAPDVPRPCSECGKQFSNYKALFGHMRSHPGRQWRGAYPPPISLSSPPVQDIKQQGEQLASSLLSIGQMLIRASEEGGDDTARTSGDQPAGGAPQRGLDIDLNVAQDPITSEPSSPSKEAVKKEIDLNKAASDESEGDK